MWWYRKATQAGQSPLITTLYIRLTETYCYMYCHWYFGMYKITDIEQMTKKGEIDPVMYIYFILLTSTKIPTKNACIISLASTECLVSSNI